MRFLTLKIMLCLLLSLIISRIEANTNNYSISGRISDERTGSPLPGASILIKGTYLWAVSDQKGEFTIQGIQEGKYQLEVSFLGYVPATVPVNVNNSIKGLKIQLKENTLALNDVIVTAQAPKSELNTTLNIGRNALEHLQISNVSDISALLPGGKTKVPDLTSNNIFSLRDGGSSAGNAAFGTAIEVDGVRIGNNSSFGNIYPQHLRGRYRIGRSHHRSTFGRVRRLEQRYGQNTYEEREDSVECTAIHQSPHRTGVLFQRAGPRQR